MTSREFCDLSEPEQPEVLDLMTDEQLIDFISTFDPDYRDVSNGRAARMWKQLASLMALRCFVARIQEAEV